MTGEARSAARSRSKQPLRILEAVFVCFLGLWLYLCTLGPVPWVAIVMWVPLFVVFAFVLGLGEAKS
jgi:uncharacterized protein (DUF983 family)